ncbi:group 1 truncated hemoglobin [Aquabacterium sp. A7-Y]|uniref:group I truncated hemoglobin n=1 Tax=Aquabacterium sp. A7-Y TaxID=1349605 RepID=UPI00223E8BB1|nr:group 1 truncated hemoglobin [Aquabacterium sp. A7-Y]MCW7541852.1 group 1 truncated hemoglobin [Aquabacterium sp. A7-Y]
MSSLFDRLGGAAAVDAAVDRFYDRVLADDRIRHFFDGVDMPRQRQHQKAFLTYAFGGAGQYGGGALRESHAPLVARGLNDEHFDAVVEDLGLTLKELGVPDDLIGEVTLVTETVREDLLGR